MDLLLNLQIIKKIQLIRTPAFFASWPPPLLQAIWSTQDSQHRETSMVAREGRRRAWVGGRYSEAGAKLEIQGRSMPESVGLPRWKMGVINQNTRRLTVWINRDNVYKRL